MPKTAAQIKAEMLKKKAAAKLEASKNKKSSSIKNKGKVKKTQPATPKPKPKPTPDKPINKPKPKFKYERIEAKSKYNPKFQEETIDDKDLKLSPAKNKGKVKHGEETRTIKTKSKVKRGGKVYKYKYKDSERTIKDKDVANEKKGTKTKQTIKNKNVKKGEVKKTKSKARVGVTGTTKKKVKGGKNRVLKTDADYKAEAARTSPMNMSGRSYDMKMAYDKKLTPKARLHYLENERNDAPGKMKGSPYHMKHGDSPMHKDLVGNQKNLPEHLKKKIEAAPQMKGSPYHMSNELKYGGPVIDQMKTLSQAGANKVLRHMKK